MTSHSRPVANMMQKKCKTKSSMKMNKSPKKMMMSKSSSKKKGYK